MPGQSDSMFWGLVLKPEKRYEQVVEEPFHISKACVEPTTCKGKVASVYVEANDEEFLVCNLSDEILNETLDLNFNQGDKIVFKSSGAGVVHLTGYNIQEDQDGPMMFESDSSDEETETEEIPALTNGKKRKATDESAAPAKKKSNKEQSPLDKPKAKEEKKQAMDMAKKIADTIKKADEDDDDSDDDDYEDVDDEDGSGEEEEGSDEDDSDDDEDADETMDSTLDTTNEAGVIRRGLSILDSTVGDTTLEGDSTLDTSELDTSALDTSAMDTSAADTPAKPIKGEKKTPAKDSPTKVAKPEGTPAKPAKAETPAKEVKKEGDKENETNNKPNGEVEASPELSKSAKKKKNKNKNKELNGAGDTSTEKSPQKPVTETKTPQKPAKEDTKTPKKGEAETKKTPAKGEAEAKKTPAKTPSKRTLKGGIQLEELKVGNGPEATDKKYVLMYYEGKLKSGKVFDSQKSGKPFKFRLGAGEVIKGWDVGIAGMKVGGKRRLTIPPAMAYGKEGAPPDIPANSHLIFEVECKGVN